LLRHRVHVVASRKSYGHDGDTKTGKTRWVDLPRQLCDELAAHLAAREHGPEARLWTGERGGPLSHQWFYQRRFKPVVEALSAAGDLPVAVAETSGGDPRVHTLR